jgi:heat-inducible transcriptional repressor
VPTDRGYRYYVDLLLGGKRPSERSSVVARIQQAASEEASIESLLSRVTHVLSQESRHLGFTIAPASDDRRLHRMEFVSLAATRVLVVAIAQSGQVSQKIVETGIALGPEELRRAADYVNREFSGLSLEQARVAILARLQEARGVYDELMRRAYELASLSLEDTPRHTLFVEGTATLLQDASQPSAEVALGTLSALVEMIEEKQRLVDLLGEYLDGPGLTVVIGAEHTLPDLRSFSLVAATYSGGGSAGSVGVIGPTRMRYSRAISVVESAARAVGSAFSHDN